MARAVSGGEDLWNRRVLLQWKSERARDHESDGMNVMNECDEKCQGQWLQRGSWSKCEWSSTLQWIKMNSQDYSKLII